MYKATTVILVTVGLIFSGIGLASADDSGIPTKRIQFDKGATSAVAKGQVKGRETLDYLIRAGAGQTLSVSLKKTNNSNYFNILPPESQNVAMFVNQTGEDYKGILPTEGDYRIRVYLVRAAARRKESSNYALTVSITGKALVPLLDSEDAMIPNTPYHAKGPIICVPYLETMGENKEQTCDAFVIRRGHDGTATVDIPQANSLTRRILFVKGKPVASDSQSPMTFSRKDDLTIVTFENGERYNIWDALIFGG